MFVAGCGDKPAQSNTSHRNLNCEPECREGNSALAVSPAPCTALCSGCGLGACIHVYRKYRDMFAFICPLGDGSPHSVIYTPAEGTTAPGQSCSSGVVPAKRQRGFVLTGGQLWMKFPKGESPQGSPLFSL